MQPVQPEHANLLVTVLSVAFAVALCFFLIVGTFLLVFVLMHFATRIIQQIWPAFLTPKQTGQGETPAEARAANKKVALDWLLAETRKRREVANVTQQEFGAFKALVETRLRGKDGGHNSDKEAISEEWNLQLLQNAVNENKPKISEADRQLINKAEFHLLKFPDGPENPPRYLCMKLNSASSEHGKNLRCAFAHLRSKSIRLDYVSAYRLAATMPGVFVAPANAAARLWIRNEGPKEKSYAAKA